MKFNIFNKYKMCNFSLFALNFDRMCFSRPLSITSNFANLLP